MDEETEIFAPSVKPCDDCGEPVLRENATTECPYAADVYSQSEACYICESCACRRADDV